jgi:pilus assembly protein CpaC
VQKSIRRLIVTIALAVALFMPACVLAQQAVPYQPADPNVQNNGPVPPVAAPVSPMTVRPFVPSVQPQAIPLSSTNVLPIGQSQPISSKPVQPGTPTGQQQSPQAMVTSAAGTAPIAPTAPVQPAPAETATTAAPSPATVVQPLPAATPSGPKTIEIPVPTLPNGPDVSGANLVLPLNKTVGVDLPTEIRDVIIGNPDIADIVVRSQKQIFLIGKKTGDTNVFFTDANGNLVRKIDVVVQPDVDGIQSNIAEMLPGEHIAVKGMGNSVVLSGTATSDGVVAKAREIARHFVAGDENIITMLRVTSEQQVLIRVRVAEAKKTVLKELGVDNLLSPQTLGPLTINAATTALGLGPDVAGTLGLATSDGSSTIRLLEQQGYIRTLAEPNLLAVSGETASMLAGGEYPIPIAQQNDTITVQYKPFGVILSFLPVVLDSGRISLRIGTEVSALSDQNTVTVSNITLKSFVTRRASSVVELPSGGELMIAGLLQNDITGSLSGVPGLMNLPILGALFRSTSFQRNETELVILVSAILAKPADPRQLALPTDGFVPSSDLDRYFLGHLQNIYVKKPPQGPTAPQSLQGPLGYIVQ